MEKSLIPLDEHFWEKAFISDGIACRHGREMVTRLIKYINRLSKVSVNISDRTVNVL